jgi:PAS domain-containing protein
VHPEDRQALEVQALCQRGLAAATAFECRIVRPGGDIRMIRVRSSPVRDGAGVVVAYHGVVCEATVDRDHETVPA